MRQLFFDCDGVLADFDAAFVARFGVAPPAYEEAHGSGPFWWALQQEPDWFRNLPVMDGAREMVARFRHLRPIILTGCPRGGWAEKQKIDWAEKHFPGVPMVCTMAANKSAYCQPGDVLVDDRPKYKPLWEKRGGHFITHKRPEWTIDDLAIWEGTSDG